MQNIELRLQVKQSLNGQYGSSILQFYSRWMIS